MCKCLSYHHHVKVLAFGGNLFLINSLSRLYTLLVHYVFLMIIVSSIKAWILSHFGTLHMRLIYLLLNFTVMF